MTPLRESLEHAHRELMNGPGPYPLEDRATAIAAVAHWLEELPEPPAPPQSEELPLGTQPPHQEA